MFVVIFISLLNSLASVPISLTLIKDLHEPVRVLSITGYLARRSPVLSATDCRKQAESNVKKQLNQPSKHINQK